MNNNPAGSTARELRAKARNLKRENIFSSTTAKPPSRPSSARTSTLLTPTPTPTPTTQRITRAQAKLLPTQAPLPQQRTTCTIKILPNQEFLNKFMPTQNKKIQMFKKFREQCKGEIFKNYLEGSLEYADYVLVAHDNADQTLCGFVFLRTPKRSERAFIELICSNKFHGRKLAVAAEKFASDLKFKILELHAIDSAESHYVKWGYSMLANPCTKKIIDGKQPIGRRRAMRGNDPNSEYGSHGFRMTKCIDPAFTTQTQAANTSKVINNNNTNKANTQFNTEKGVEILKKELRNLSIK